MMTSVLVSSTGGQVVRQRLVAASDTVLTGAGSPARRGHDCADGGRSARPAARHASASSVSPAGCLIQAVRGLYRRSRRLQDRDDRVSAVPQGCLDRMSRRKQFLQDIEARRGSAGQACWTPPVLKCQAQICRLASNFDDPSLLASRKRTARWASSEPVVLKGEHDERV
jgi:hypothetical protein